MKGKWRLTDTGLLILTCSGILLMVISDEALYRFVCGVYLLVLAYTMTRRVFQWKRRAIGTRIMYEDLIEALKENHLMVVSTCLICHQDVTDREQHMRKAHGWSPRPS